MKTSLFLFSALMTLSVGCLRATSTSDRWPCKKSSDCPSGEVCKAEYAFSDDCSREGSCHCYEKGYCQHILGAELGAALACPFGEVCVNEGCVAVACVGDTDCEQAATGTLCVNGICAASCYTGGFGACGTDPSLTCIYTQTGADTVCYPACGSDANCPPGYRCDTGDNACRIPCSNKGGCPGALQCSQVSGFCN